MPFKGKDASEMINVVEETMDCKAAPNYCKKQ